MSGDGRRYARITLRISRALWPGGAAVCTVADAGKLGKHWWLIGRDGRPHGLRPYRYGMRFGEVVPWRS